MSKQRFGGLKHGPCPDGPRGKPKKMADGGPVRSYGAPIDRPKPGGTTRQRPKVGDKSDDTRLKDNPRGKRPAPPPKKEAKPDTRRVPAPTRRRLKDNDVY